MLDYLYILTICLSIKISDIISYVYNGINIEQIFKTNILIYRNDKDNFDTYVLLKHAKK